MTITMDPKQTLPHVQLAAGGLVWRQIDGKARLAVIHRPKYDDWTLPKGKPNPDENLAQTAQREVWEELGCAITFLDFAGTVHYPRGKGQLKIVLFWHMLPAGEFQFVPNSEVDEVQWLTPAEAARKLVHRVEVELVKRSPPPAFAAE